MKHLPTMQFYLPQASWNAARDSFVNNETVAIDGNAGKLYAMDRPTGGRFRVELWLYQGEPVTAAFASIPDEPEADQPIEVKAG